MPRAAASSQAPELSSTSRASRGRVFGVQGLWGSGTFWFFRAFRVFLGCRVGFGVWGA